MNTPYDTKLKVESKKNARPQAASEYRPRIKSLLKFAAIFFAIMAIGTVAVSLLLLAK